MKRRTALQLIVSSALAPRSLTVAAEIARGPGNAGELEFEISDPDTLCDLGVKSFGLKAEHHFGQGGLRLVRDAAGQEAYLVLTLPPQHLYEEAFFETTLAEIPPTNVGLVRGVFSNLTRVVLAVRPDVKFIPLTQGALLDWERYYSTVFLPAGAIPASAIEVPSGLLIAPDQDSKWDSSRTPGIVASGRLKVEQWYVRRVPVRSDVDVFVLRPIDTVDVRFRPMGGVSAKCEGGPTNGFISSLSLDNRKAIVATFSGKPGSCASPVPPVADTLTLSSSGASLSVVAKHPTQDYGCDVEGWIHRVSGGRDTYARVEVPGFHYPHGVKTTLLEITERRMQRDSKGVLGAFLRKEYVLQRVPDAVVTQDFLDMPFVDLRMTTERTPPLDFDPSWQPTCDEPALAGVIDRRYPLLFRPFVGGVPVRMAFAGHDKVGTDQPDLLSTSIFVPYKLIDRVTGRLPDAIQKIVDDAWQADQARPYRVISLGGRRLPLARESKPGDTQLNTRDIELVRASDVPVDATLHRSKVPFWSRIFRANVEPQALTPMLGRASTVEVTIRKTVDRSIDQERTDPVDASFDPRQSERGIFCRLVHPLPADFAGGGTNRVGGVVTPSILVAGLAQDGLASGAELATLRFLDTGALSIGPIFKGINARFLGGLQLSDLFSLVAAKSIGDLPALAYQLSGGDPLIGPPAIPNPGNIINPATAEPFDLVSFPAQLSAQLKWRYDWAEDASPVLIFRPRRNAAGETRAATLFLDARVGVDLRGGEPKVSASGRLTDFEIAFPSAASEDDAWITVPFETVEFDVSPGAKPQFRPVIGEVRFGGEFKFIADMAEKLKSLGRSNVTIDVDSSGVGVRHSISIDPISIGAMQISNLSLVYGMRLPFDGSTLLVDVGISTRDDPFTISISGYAGAGSFRALLGAAGPLALEVSLEFGGSYEANFGGGLARGKAYLMAGIFFGLHKLADGSQDTTLEGYVRTGGNLDVLRIGSVSVVAYLRLRYSSQNGAEGSVTVTISIRIALVEITQHFEAHQQYSGGGGGGHVQAFGFMNGANPKGLPAPGITVFGNQKEDPFAATYSQADWDQYWSAFA